MKCNSCNYDYSTGEERNEHYNSSWHRYNTKRYCAGLTPVSLEFFAQKLSAIRPKAIVPASCDLCNTMCKNAEAYERHIRTKGHKKRELWVERQQKRQQAEEAGEIKTQEQIAIEQNLQPHPKVEWAEPIAVGDCIFCRKRFGEDNLAHCCDHMLKDHGFFIPFIEYLDSVTELVGWIGAKVGMGGVCLWCSKHQFGSLHALRHHMDSKSHCKINLDDEDREELAAFYTFPGEEYEKTSTTSATTEGEGAEDGVEGKSSSSSSTSMVLVNQPQKSKVGVRGKLPTGELVLTDGSILGHRKYRQYYKQHIRKKKTNDAILIRNLRSQYRGFQIAAYNSYLAVSYSDMCNKQNEKRRKRDRFKHEQRSSDVNPRMNDYHAKLM